MKESTERALNAIGETAAEWLLVMQDHAAMENHKAAFIEWLRQSPLHVHEYLRAEAAWLALDAASRHDNTDIETLLRDAVPNVVSLGAYDQSLLRRAEPRLSNDHPVVISKAWAFAALVLLGVGIALFSPSLIHWWQTETYRTDTGEQRRILLDDGTIIDLNTQSALRAKLDARSREVELLVGEAIFNVAKDTARPFSVTAGAQHITALGTSFSVRQEARSTTVTLLEGKISVAPARASGHPSGAQIIDKTGSSALLLHPGQRATFSEKNEKPALDTPPLEKVVAWRQHRLIFENQTVADVVAEFNRYNRRQIVVADAELNGERIDGVFDADKPQNLLDFIVRNTGAHIEEQSDRVMVVK